MALLKAIAFSTEIVVAYTLGVTGKTQQEHIAQLFASNTLPTTPPSSGQDLFVRLTRDKAEDTIAMLNITKVTIDELRNDKTAYIETIVADGIQRKMGIRRILQFLDPQGTNAAIQEAAKATAAGATRQEMGIIDVADQIIQADIRQGIHIEDFVLLAGMLKGQMIKEGFASWERMVAIDQVIQQVIFSYYDASAQKQ